MIPKFRAYDKNSKQMINSIVSIDFEFEYITFEVEESMNRKTYFGEVTFMQSTGLHDKNGVEIFEGDLIHYTYKEFDWYVPVVYRKSRFEVYHGALSTIPASEIPSGKYATNIGNSISMYRAEFTDMYVAGNIYENPELLEATKWATDRLKRQNT